MNKVKHLGIIPDGSRRWAHKEGIELVYSYRLAMKNIMDLLSASYEREIDAVSVFLLSKANLKRSSEDLESVARAEEELLADMLPPFAESFSVSVHIAGLPDLAPIRIQNGVRKLLAASSERPVTSKRRLYLCVAYDPLDELTAAVSSFRSKGISSLWVPERIDLVIRTGGAITISNFLPLQCGYARVVFREELFNDFSPATLLEIVQEHESARLKFGE